MTVTSENSDEINKSLISTFYEHPVKNKSGRMINSDTLQNNLELPLELLMHAREPHDQIDHEIKRLDCKLLRPPTLVIISS